VHTATVVVHQDSAVPGFEGDLAAFDRTMDAGPDQD
jgi:hypothetical protein